MMETRPNTVVLGVDLIPRAAYDLAAQAVLAQWRDGQLRPVVTRALLHRQATILKRLGLSEPVVRGWLVWLTATEHSLYLTGEDREAEYPLTRLYLEAAELGGADTIITSRPAPPCLPGGLRWVKPSGSV